MLQPVHRFGQLRRVQHRHQLENHVASVVHTQLKMFCDNQSDLTHRKNNYLLIGHYQHMAEFKSGRSRRRWENADGPFRA